MPIITELTDSFIAEMEKDKFGQESQRNKDKLKQWMHLNHILNCKTTSCKTFVMAQKHLLPLSKINADNVILIPSDYQIGSYSDAILTIICARSENCSVCLKLLDHLSCHKKYCECNNYKEICYHQLYLKNTVEQFPVSGNSFNIYNEQCSSATKEKIKSLEKYHQQAMKVVDELKDFTKVKGSSVGKSVDQINNNSREMPINRPTFSKQSKNHVNPPSKDNSESSQKDAKTSHEQDDSSALTPYRPQTSQYVLSDESLIDSSDESSSDFDFNSGNVNTNFHINFDMDSSDASTEDSLVTDPGDHESFRYAKRAHSHNMHERNHTLTSFDLSDTTEDYPEVSSEFSSFNCRNNTNEFRRSNASNYSYLSDESFIDNESDGEEEEHIHEHINKRPSQYSRNRKSIRVQMFSDESLIDYSDEEGCNFTNKSSTGINTNSHFTVSDESSSEFENRVGSDVPTKDSDLLEDTSSLIIVDVTGTSGIESQSTVETPDDGSRNVFASTPFHSASFRCKEYSSDCWYCGVEDNISTYKTSTNTSLSQLHEVTPTSDVHKPKHKRYRKKIKTTSSKNKHFQQRKSKEQKKPHKMIHNMSSGKEDNPCTSKTANQRKFLNKNNNPPTASNSKKSSFGGINMSYVRNVLAQQNAQTGRKGPLEKRKNQTRKQTPIKNKKKMKLYDSSTWIESSNYDQLCNSNMERF